jgi:hypothetical protein
MYLHCLTQAKKDILEKFDDAKKALRILFATISLGMGADLKTVERVYNIGPPTTVESKMIKVITWLFKIVHYSPFKPSLSYYTKMMKYSI